MPYSTGLLASLRLARSPLYAFRCLVLPCFDSGTLTLVTLEALSSSTRAPARVGAARLDRRRVVRVLALSVVVGCRVLPWRRAEMAFQLLSITSVGRGLFELSICALVSPCSRRLYSFIRRSYSKGFVSRSLLIASTFSSSVEGRSTGIMIKLSGYITKIDVLLGKLLNTMGGLQVGPGFGVAKERLWSFLENYASLKPRHQVFWLVRWLNHANWYPHKQMLAELRTLTAADVKEFYPRLLGQMHIETLASGWIYKEDALRLSSMVETAFKPVPLPQAEWPIIAESLAFPPASSFIYHQTLTHSQIADHCIYYYLYTRPRFDSPTRAKTLLLGQMISAPAFDQLRTQEQLGYVVLSGATETATNMSYRILIQSTKAPTYLAGRIDTFLTKFTDILREMSKSEFELHKSSLVRERLGKLKPKDLKQEASRV